MKARALVLVALLLLAVAAALPARAQDASEPATPPPTPGPAERLARGLFVAPLRYRHEYRDDHDLRSDAPDHDNRDLLKIGFGIDAKPLDVLRARVQLRYTRSWGRNVVNPALRIDPFGQDALDLFEAFVEVPPVPAFPFGARVGRQVLAYGEERLVGPLEFIQNARTWDAVKLLFGTDTVSVDAWWGRRVQFEGPDDHNFNEPVDTVDFFGIYGVVKPLDDALSIEPFLLARYDDNHALAGERGERGHHFLRLSPGARVAWKAPAGFTLTEEFAIQTGEVADDDVFAWASATRVLWTAPAALRPLFQLEVEYAFASGDSNPRDGDVNTFDSFYPTNHKFYGEIDFVGWQNIHAIELTARVELFSRKLRDAPAAASRERPYLHERALPAVIPATLAPTIEVGWHWFFLAEEKDAWYNAALVPVRRDPTGEAGRALGRELDVVFRAGPVSIGYAHFFPGSFVRRTVPSGANTSGADLLYAEVLLAF